MDRRDLGVILRAEDINPRTFDIKDGLPDDECYVLRWTGFSWSVFYGERGNQNDRHDFSSESEACEYLLEVLRNDPTVRMRS